MSGAPLFSSKDKFDSGIGWPSFRKPLDGAPIKEESYQPNKTNRVKLSDNSPEGHGFHLGVKMKDKGQKDFYCIYSEALVFRPVSDLTDEEIKEYGFKRNNNSSSESESGR